MVALFSPAESAEYDLLVEPVAFAPVASPMYASEYDADEAAAPLPESIREVKSEVEPFIFTPIDGPTDALSERTDNLTTMSV